MASQLPDEEQQKSVPAGSQEEECVSKRALDLLNQEAIAQLAEAKRQIEDLKAKVTLLESQKNEKLVEEIIEVRKAAAKIEGELAEAKVRLEEAKERENALRGSVLEALKHIVFERIPTHWGVGPTQMNLKLKHLIADLERGGPQN